MIVPVQFATLFFFQNGSLRPSRAVCCWLLVIAPAIFQGEHDNQKEHGCKSNAAAQPVSQLIGLCYILFHASSHVARYFDCQLKRQGKRNKVQRFYISLGHCVSAFSGHLDWGQGIPSQNQHELQVRDFAPCDQFIELENLKLLEHWGHCLQALLPTPLYNTSLNISILYKNTTSTFVYNTSLQHFAQHLFTKHLPPKASCHSCATIFPIILPFVTKNQH